MNAVEIIRAVRQHGAEVIADGEHLFLRGTGPKLPAPLRSELAAHKAEPMIALGSPIDAAVASVLNDVRPHLPESLRRLPDDRLLILVNWTIMAAWSKAVERVKARA